MLRTIYNIETGRVLNAENIPAERLEQKTAYYAGKGFGITEDLQTETFVKAKYNPADGSFAEDATEEEQAAFLAQFNTEAE